MTNRHPKIGIFDSGIGGVSILRELRQQLPHCHYFYCSDYANFPYGGKSASKVLEVATEVSLKFLNRYDLDYLVIACNTASTIALDSIRSQCSIPIVGVVPAIKPAVGLTKNGCIGLLATPGTVARPYTLELIERFAQGVKVYRYGSPTLVSLCEEYLQGIPPTSQDIKEAMEPLIEMDREGHMDVVVLGCTHYPLLRPLFEKHLSREFIWVDSGEAIARRLKSLLGESPNTDSLQAGSAVFTITGKSVPSSQVIEMFAGEGLVFDRLM